MLVEVDAELVRALVDVLAVHAGGERRLLELLLHGLGLQPLEPARAHERARVDEPGQLVAGEQRLLQRRVARQPEMLRVREDGLDDVVGIALLAQDRCAVLRMLVQRRMHLVVEVVQERRYTPKLLVLPELACVRGGGRLDRERVPAQRLALRVARQCLPGLVASGRHGAPLG